MPDTLKAQHTGFLTAGHVCYSDMGRVLCSITADSLGWHDTWCGVSDAAMVLAQYGEKRYQQHRNAMHRNGRDNLLIELAKWGLGARDLVRQRQLLQQGGAPMPTARSAFVPGHSEAGQLRRSALRDGHAGGAAAARRTRSTQRRTTPPPRAAHRLARRARRRRRRLPHPVPARTAAAFTNTERYLCGAAA